MLSTSVQSFTFTETGGVNECNDIFHYSPQENLSAAAVLGAVWKWVSGFFLWMYHNAARVLLSYPKTFSKISLSFGSSLLIHERRKPALAPQMNEGCAGMKCSRALLSHWNIGSCSGVGINFIYLPAPPKNVRLFVVLAVLVTKKQFTLTVINMKPLF